jgi:hypothetical protein
MGATVAKIVVVHGINNTYLGPEQHKQLFLSALSDGVVVAGRKALAGGDAEFVFYGDVFRPRGRFLSDDIHFLTAADIEDGFELDLLIRWWTAAAQVDPGVVPPDARTLGAGSSARAAVLALSGSAFLARVSERMLVWWIKQVTAYFTVDVVRAEIQARFATAKGPDTRVVVAHSLGSVVAPEGLCALAGGKVTDFVTLGAPLGVRHIVFDRLRPEPATLADRSLLGSWPGTTRWVNLSDLADFVALQPRLRTLFGDRVVDVAINNGLSAHKLQRYLSAAETGSVVLAGLRG